MDGYYYFLLLLSTVFMVLKGETMLVKSVLEMKDFFLIWVLWPFQEYFPYIEPIVHQIWAKTGEPGENPPDHP